jgi:ferredoxin-NADP reductase
VSGAALDLEVLEARAETPLVRAIRLGRPDGGPLPSWQAGAHVKVVLPTGDERSYSLVKTGGEGSHAPRAYRLGVRLDDPSEGGSRHMHCLRAGDRLRVGVPTNTFALEPGPGSTVLLAGGIGITPLLSMAAELAETGRPFRVHYAGRSRNQLPFLPEIEALAGERLHVHADDEAGGFFDVEGLLASLTGHERLYVCGPTPMIDAAIAGAKARGWTECRLRFEHFGKTAPRADDGAFEVVLQGSGRSFRIPPDRSILDVLIDAGLDPLHDCKRGDCAVCQVEVAEGVPDHRDFVLSDAEKASNKLMQICVSRSKTPRLVIAL